MKHVAAARSFRLWLVPVAALALAGCWTLYPGPSDDYDVRFAQGFYSAQRSGSGAMPVEQLTDEQLYAVHRLGLNRMHPARSMNAEYARRGGAAVPFLRAMLERQRSFGQVGSILEALKAMQDAGSYDVRQDPALVALIGRTARSYGDDPYKTLVNLADELETGTRIPFNIQPYYRAPRLGGLLREGRGRDYDVDFASGYCRGCSYREWTSGLDRRPIEQLYALQRYSAESLFDRYNIDHVIARRGAGAVAFLKSKLAGPVTDIMVWNILSTLELMRALGTYDVAADPELMRLAEAAARRADPADGPIARALIRLRTGETIRTLPARPMG